MNFIPFHSIVPNPDDDDDDDEDGDENSDDDESGNGIAAGAGVEGGWHLITLGRRKVATTKNIMVNVNASNARHSETKLITLLGNVIKKIFNHCHYHNSHCHCHNSYCYCSTATECHTNHNICQPNVGSNKKKRHQRKNFSELFLSRSSSTGDENVALALHPVPGGGVFHVVVFVVGVKLLSICVDQCYDITIMVYTYLKVFTWLWILILAKTQWEKFHIKIKQKIIFVNSIHHEKAERI